MTIEPGAIVGERYQLERPLGSGGMATVWLAHDRLLDRKVAFKLLAERYASDPAFVERFRREASAAAGLSHPNIVTVFDRGEADGSYYIVMEHLPGPDLKGILRERGRLDQRQAVDAALQVLAAVGAAHRRNVIHRDIKPQNVLVSEDGNLKVTDFGIARAGDDAGMTEVGSVIGTAQYLSPEQARGQEVTTASDCYSVGILLYEMLTGRVPFDGDKPVAIAMRQINETPVAPRVLVPTINPQLNDIVMKALEKRPGSRYRTAEEFSQALMAVRALLPPPVEDATQVLAATDAAATGVLPVPPAQPSEVTAATRVQPRQPSMPPHSRRKSRAPLIGALVGVLLLAIGAYGFFFTDIGRAAKVTVPEVTRLNEQQARTALEAAGFTRLATERVNDSDVEVDLVVRTDPEEGSKAATDDLVTIFLSAGPQTAPVPRVVGLEAADAVTELARFGFTAERENVFSDTIETGKVVRQDPLAGQPHPVDEPVRLFVSEGPEPIEVPNVLLSLRFQAEAALRIRGFEVEVAFRETDRRPEGTVVAQDPVGGTRLARGETVTITVAQAPEPQTIPMPDIVGNAAGAAQQKLRDLGFGEATSSSRPDDSADGTVLEQDPPAGTQVDPERQRVAIIVSSGPLELPVDPGTSTVIP